MRVMKVNVDRVHKWRPVAARAGVVLALALGLQACGDTWFGSEDEVILPGQRISVLEHERRIQPTAGANVNIRLPAPQPNGDWPQAGGYSHHAMHHLKVADRPEEAWTADAGKGSDSRNRLLGDPIVANGKVYAIDAEAAVSAFDAETGDRLWRTELAPEYEEDDALLGAGIAYADGRIFASTGFAQVVALDAESGAEAWRTTVTAPMRAAPTVLGGRVFVTTLDNTGLALAAADGRILWTHSAVEEVAAIIGGAAPAADGGVVVMPFTSGEVVALRTDNGTPLWADSVVAARRTEATANLADVRARPVIDDNRIYVLGHSGLLTAIDMRTGRRAWELEVAGLDQPWVAGNFLYLLTVDAQVVAVDARNGAVLWVTSLPLWEDPEERSGRLIWSGPTLASDRLIVTGAHGEAVSLDPYSGELLGRIDLPDGVRLPPAVADGTLYFFTEGADIVALR